MPHADAPRSATSGTRVLFVVADDFGLTVGTSAAIVEAHRAGIVTATSVLGNAPALEASAPLLADAPELEVGLHVALVGEDPPVAPPSAIPTLVDGAGRLHASWRSLLPRLAAGRVDPADVRREIDAQLAKVRDLGLVPRHLNLHQHLQLWPLVGQATAQACTAHGIGYVRTPSSSARSPKGAGIRRLSVGLARTLASAGITTNDGFAGLDEAGRWNATRLVAAIESAVGPRFEVNVHPGSARDSDRERYRWGYSWGEELAALVAPSVRAAVRDAGWQLAAPGSTC